MPVFQRLGEINVNFPLAFLCEGKTFVVKNLEDLERLLAQLREDHEARQVVIWDTQFYLLIVNRFEWLEKEGYIEFRGPEPKPSEDLALAVGRFAKILRKEFPEDWQNVQERFDSLGWFFK